MNFISGVWGYFSELILSMASSMNLNLTKFCSMFVLFIWYILWLAAFIISKRNSQCTHLIYLINFLWCKVSCDTLAFWKLCWWTWIVSSRPIYPLYWCCWNITLHPRWFESKNQLYFVGLVVVSDLRSNGPNLVLHHTSTSQSYRNGMEKQPSNQWDYLEIHQVEPRSKHLISLLNTILIVEPSVSLKGFYFFHLQIE